MTKAHAHHHTDGMARAVGTSGSSASIWARTHRSGRGLRRGSRFGWRSGVRDVAVFQAFGLRPGEWRHRWMHADPFRADTTWTAARRYLRAA